MKILTWTKTHQTQGEFVNRVAGLLDYYLDKLIGPEVKEVKVRNPEKVFLKSESASYMLLSMLWIGVDGRGPGSG